ncbi:MFS general substrate transporter, partial [Ceratobasidium sp. AG-I]
MPRGIRADHNPSLKDSEDSSLCFPTSPSTPAFGFSCGKVMDIPLEPVATRDTPRTHPNASATSVHWSNSASNRASQNILTPASSGQLPQVSSNVSTLQSDYATQEANGIESNSTPLTLEPSNLAPADRGIQAWMYLVGAFVVQTLLWGVPNSFGVFLTYYSDAFYGEAGADLLLPFAGTLCSGLMYCSGPILYPIVARYPSQRRTSMWIGNVICFGSLFGASYATKPWQIVLLQGGGYGLGGSLLYAPTISYMSEWFFERRGLANGVMYAGTAVGGLVLPLILPSAIQSHGTAVILRYLAVVVFVLLSAFLPFIRPRLPEGRTRSMATVSTRRWSTNKSFWLVLFVTTLQGFAYFLPILYLPTFAKEMKLSDSQASLALALLNGSSVISRISLGHLSDILNPWTLMTLTLAATSLSTFVLWGALRTSIATLSTYAIIFGALSGGFSSLWAGFVRPIAKDDPTAATSMLGMLMLSRGLGNVLSTPLSSALLVGSVREYVHTGLQSDSRWANLIIYVGTVFAG